MTDRHQLNGFRTFLIVWGTQSLPVFGSALTFFAMTIWLTQVLYPRPEEQPQLAFALSLVAPGRHDSCAADGPDCRCVG